MIGHDEDSFHKATWTDQQQLVHAYFSNLCRANQPVFWASADSAAVARELVPGNLAAQRQDGRLLQQSCCQHITVSVAVPRAAPTSPIPSTVHV